MNPPPAIAEMGRKLPPALRDPSTPSPEARASRRNRLPRSTSRLALILSHRLAAVPGPKR
jgi:hypothetical protein